MSNEIDINGNAVQRIVATHNDITTLAAGGSIALAGRMTGRVLHAVSQVVLARLLGAGAFGLYGIGWTILNIVEQIASAGLYNGVIRFGSRYWRTDNEGLKQVLFQSLRLTFFASLVIGGGLLLLAPWLAEQVFHKTGLTPVLRLFAVALPLVTCLRVASAATRISQRMKFSVYAETVGQPAANLILILIFYLVGWRLLGAVAAAVLSFGVASLLALYYVRHLFPEAFAPLQKTDASARELLAFSIPTAFTGLFAFLIIGIDRLFVGYFRPATEVGVYHAASQLSVLFFMVISALNTIFASMIADLYHKREMKRLEELFRVSTKWGLYLSLPVFLVIFFNAQEVMMAVFGKEYASGALPLFILTIGMLINVATGPVGSLLIMTGHQNRWLVIYSVIFIMDISLNWLLVPRLGLIGAALATAISMSGLFLIGLFQTRRILKLWPYDRRYLKGLLATILSVVMLFLFRQLDIVLPLLSVLMSLVISSVIYGVTFLLLGLDAEDREFMRIIQKRFAQLKS